MDELLYIDVDEIDETAIGQLCFRGFSAPAIPEDKRQRLNDWAKQYAAEPPLFACCGTRRMTRRRIRRDVQRKMRGVGFPPVLIGAMLVYYVLMIAYWIRRWRNENRQDVTTP